MVRKEAVGVRVIVSCKEAFCLMADGIQKNIFYRHPHGMGQQLDVEKTRIDRQLQLDRGGGYLSCDLHCCYSCFLHGGPSSRYILSYNNPGMYRSTSQNVVLLPPDHECGVMQLMWQIVDSHGNPFTPACSKYL